MKSNHHYQYRSFLYAVLVLFVLLAVVPYLWMFITSIKSQNDIYTKDFRFIPAAPTFANYLELLTRTKFVSNLYNSLVVGIGTVFLSLVISTMAAYGFSRFRFRGRAPLISSYLIIYMFPPVLLLVPLFTIMRGFGLLNTLTGLVIAYCTFSVPLSVWLMIGFINDIPKELEESAMIDGCNRVQAFFKIISPVLAPGLSATGSYIFIFAWNEFLYALMFTNEATRTLPVALEVFIGQFMIQWGLLTSGGVIIIIPVLILFFIFQRRLVQGLSAGAVKG